MITALQDRVNRLLPSLEREDRVPVAHALFHSDGTVLSFEQELAAQCWDFPTLDVQSIMDQVCFDVA
jgi:hypothetical protein